ncbi:MAG: right-handed parallel beta-helix repeat-containing protein, partial [Candidatus Micrarchaeota archaeon]|nr:right-handed parallel beta-helix repeat-containing protein [Candidatus Micrarchaeota archaeon]
YGAYLYTSDYNSISNSSFNSNNIGLSMQFSSYNNISRSTAMSTGSDGIYMDTSASNRITDTTVTSSAGIGISILFSGSNVLANVTATSDGDSLYMWGSASNAISNSTFTSANGYGIDLSGSASNSFINVSNNRNYTDPNQKFYSDAAQDVTSSYLNTGYWPLLNSRGADATDISKTAYYNGTAGGKSWNAGLSDWVSAPNNRYWYNNQTNYTFGCGAILESGSTYQLDRNLTEASSSNCFDLNSLTNVTFDCNGHKITGPTGSGTAAFSLLLTNYATIKNCVIDGFDTGIDARGQAPGFICHHFCEWQDGIYYNGHNFTNNTISAGNAGVYQSYINSSSISDSRISSASNVAVDLESVAYSTITNSNIASANGVGIFIVGNGIDTGANTISNSNVTSVNGHGIYLSASTYNTISNVNSTASGANANGIYIASSSSNTISNAYAYSQDRVGIWIDGSNYNSIDRSTGIGIGTDEHGIIILSVSSYNNITNSNGTATNGNGIWVDNGDRNQIINCIGTSTGGRGLMLSSASNNIIANSTGTSTSSYGAYLTASSINSIINSTIRSTNTNAFYITGGSDQNTFYWNSFVAPNGLYISDDSGGTNFFNTTIGGHAEGNIYPNISSSNFTGNVSSSYGASWWVGTAGNAYPYSITASGGKITSGVVDYGPLFYTFVPTPIPPPAPGTNNGGGEVYIPPAEQPATPAVEPQPSEQNVTPPAQPQLHTFESATKAIADAEAALNEAVKEGRDISQSVWALSAARDALAKGDYAEAERLAALAVSQIGEKGSSAPSGQIGEPGIPQIVEQNGLPLATIVIIGGAVALLGAGIFAYMTWGRKN